MKKWCYVEVDIVPWGKIFVNKFHEEPSIVEEQLKSEGAFFSKSENKRQVIFTVSSVSKKKKK